MVEGVAMATLGRARANIQACTRTLEHTHALSHSHTHTHVRTRAHTHTH